MSALEEALLTLTTGAVSTQDLKFQAQMQRLCQVNGNSKLDRALELKSVTIFGWPDTCLKDALKITA